MQLRHKDNRLALAGILLAIAFSKSNAIFTKHLLGEGWTPLSLYFLTLLVLTILLSLHEFMLLEKGNKWGMGHRDVRGMLLTTLTGGILAPLLFMYGLSFVQASEAVLITSLLPLFIVLFAVWFLGEKFSRSMLTGGLFLLAGMAALVWQDILRADLSPGVPLLVGSSVCSALTTTLHKKYVKNRHLDSIVLVRTFISLLIVGAVVAVTEPETFAMLKDPPSIWLVLGLSVLGFLLPYFLYFRALARLSTLDAGLIATAGPAIGVLMAAGFLGEAITPEQIVSITLIAFGILFINVPLTKLRIMPSRIMELGPLRR